MAHSVGCLSERADERRRRLEGHNNQPRRTERAGGRATGGSRVTTISRCAPSERASERAGDRRRRLEGHNNQPVLDQSSHSFLIVLKSGPTRLIGWNFRGERLIDTATSHYSLLQLFYSPKVQHSIYWQAVYIPNILNRFQTLVSIVYLACKLFIKLLTAYTQPAIGILVSHVEGTTAL